MGDNLKIRKLRLDITQTLNNSHLPIEVKRMIVNDILLELNQLAEAEIQKEAEELAKEQEKSEVKNGE